MESKKRASYQIIEDIKNKIKTGEFPVNSKLPSENNLAKMFNVSRVPIREALSALSSQGIIKSVRGGGSWVNPVTFDKLLEKPSIDLISYKQIIELLETRIILETRAAGLAAERHNNKDLKSMYFAQDELFKEIDNNNKIEDQADFLFHKSIIQATKNDVLIQTVENLSDLYNRALKTSLSLNTKIEGKKKQVYEEHQSILKAITLKEADKAEKSMYLHLSNSMKKLKERKNEINDY